MIRGALGGPVWRYEKCREGRDAEVKVPVVRVSGIVLLEGCVPSSSCKWLMGMYDIGSLQC